MHNSLPLVKPSTVIICLMRFNFLVLFELIYYLSLVTLYKFRGKNQAKLKTPMFTPSKFFNKIILCIVSLVTFFSLSISKTNAQSVKYIDSTLDYISLEHFRDFDTSHLHNYYEVKEHRIFSKGISFDTSFINKNRSVIQLYVAVPIYSDYNFTKEDTLMMFENEDFSYRGCYGLDKLKYEVYLAIEYDTSISNKLNSYEQKVLRDSFIKNSMSDFENRELDSFVYLKCLSSSSIDYNRYNKIITSSTKPIILIPINAPFADRNKKRKKK